MSERKLVDEGPPRADYILKKTKFVGDITRVIYTKVTSYCKKNNIPVEFFDSCKLHCNRTVMGGIMIGNFVIHDAYLYDDTAPKLFTGNKELICSIEYKDTTPYYGCFRHHLFYYGDYVLYLSKVYCEKCVDEQIKVLDHFLIFRDKLDALAARLEKLEKKE